MLKRGENVFSASWLHYPSSHRGEMVNTPFKCWIKANTKGVCLESPLQI